MTVNWGQNLRVCFYISPSDWWCFTTKVKVGLDSGIPLLARIYKCTLSLIRDHWPTRTVHWRPLKRDLNFRSAARKMTVGFRRRRAAKHAATDGEAGASFSHRPAHIVGDPGTGEIWAPGRPTLVSCGRGEPLPLSLPPDMDDASWTAHNKVTLNGY